MSALTPERLAYVRQKAEDFYSPEDERFELLIEVERLWDWIERTHRRVDTESGDMICGYCSWQLPNGRFFGKVVKWPCETAALIPPPAEGESNDT